MFLLHVLQKKFLENFNCAILKYFLIYKFICIFIWSYLRSLLVINLDITFFIIVDFNASIKQPFKYYFEKWTN